MAASINFLSERRKKLTKQQLVDLKIFRVVSGVGIGILLALLIAVGSRLFFSYTLTQIAAKQSAILALVKSQEESEKSYVIFAAKLRVISELFVQRRDKQEAIKYFSTLFGPDVLVSDIEYEADTSLLTFGLEAKNIFTLETVFNRLNTQEVKDQFASVAATELRRDKFGTYQTSVLVTLKEETKPGAAGAANETTPKVQP